MIIRLLSFLLLFIALQSATLYGQQVRTFQKAFGGSKDDRGISVLQTKDKGFLLLGTTQSYGSGGSDLMLIKTDSLGRQIWTKTYGGSKDEVVPNIQTSSAGLIQTPDGNFVICSQTSSYGSGNSDVYLLKVDTSGNVLWTRTFGG